MGWSVFAQGGEGRAFSRLEDELDSQDIADLPSDPLRCLCPVFVVAVVKQLDLGKILRSTVRGLGKSLDRTLRIKSVGVSFDRSRKSWGDERVGRGAGSGEHRRAERLAVNCHRERLTHLLVGEWLLAQGHRQHVGAGKRIRDERFGELGVSLDFRNLDRLQVDDVHIPGSVGFKCNGGIINIDVFDAVQLGPTLPIVVIGSEGPLLTFRNAGDRERAIADMVLSGLPPVIRVRVDDLLLDGVGDPEGTDRVIVRSRVCQVDLEREVVEGLDAQGVYGSFMFFGSVFASFSRLVRSQAGELCATDDLEEDGLILTSGGRVAVAFDRVAEVLGGQRRTVTVDQVRAEMESDLRGVLVVLPGFGGARNSLLVGVEPGQTFIGESKDVDLIAERAFLGINDVRVSNVVDTEDFAILRRGPSGQDGNYKCENRHDRGELRPIARHAGHELPPVAKNSPGTRVVAGDTQASRAGNHCQSTMKMELQELRKSR